MTQVWWLVDIVSRLLDPDEREAVLGDFSESGEHSVRALGDVLGLIARRQAKVWAGWRPWLTLVGLIFPLGMLLSIVSRTTADTSSVYIWLYVNNWDLHLMSNPGFWRLFAESAVLVFLWLLTLACCSWTSGFALGSASRGMTQINGVVLCLMLTFGELAGAPLYFAFCAGYAHRALGASSLPDYNAAVFELGFYRVMFPLLVQAGLVAFPALSGLRQGSHAAEFRLPWRIVLGIGAVVTLAAMVVQNQAFWLFLNAHVVHAYMQPGPWLGRGIRLLQYVVFWPVAYLLAREISRRRDWIVSCLTETRRRTP